MGDLSKLQVIDSPPAGGPGLEFLFDTSTSQKFQIGQRVCLSNGAVYHYAYALTALTRNTIASAGTLAAGFKSNLILGSGSTAAYGGAVGDLSVRVKCSNTAITENQFQGGQYIICSHSASLNSTQNLLIKSHPAAASGTECVLELEQPLLFTVDSRSKGNLVQNPFYNVQNYDSTPEAYAVGLAVTTVAATSYCWLQTWGPNAAACSAAFPKIGGCITCGSTTGGVVSSAAQDSYYPIIGFGGVNVGASSQLMPMFLTIMP